MFYLIYKISSSYKGICAAYKVDLETHLELSLFFFCSFNWTAWHSPSVH